MADGWALGCLAHFCVAGKPLFFGDKEEVLEQLRERSAAAESRVHFEEAEQSLAELRDYEDLAARDFVDQLTLPGEQYDACCSIVKLEIICFVVSG